MCRNGLVIVRIGRTAGTSLERGIALDSRVFARDALRLR
jgi:hypothetical protein